MDNLAGCVEGTLGFAILHLQQILKHFPQHFRIDRHFLIQWLIFPHRKVIQVKGIQNGLNRIVGN